MQSLEYSLAHFYIAVLILSKRSGDDGYDDHTLHIDFGKNAPFSKE